MIGAVEITNNPITDAVMNCLFRRQSSKEHHGPQSPANSVKSNTTTRSMSSDSIGHLGDWFDSPKDPLDPVKKPYGDSILEYILDEEGEGLMEDIETIGLLLVKFWCVEAT